MGTPKITIIENGPYLVRGNVPLFEQFIQSDGHEYQYVDGKVFDHQEEYTLCRCGKSKKMPFCDGRHKKRHFDGTETASNVSSIEIAKTHHGQTLDLIELDKLCAYARFCHTEEGNTWDLTMQSDEPYKREAAIRSASKCPSGKLVAWDKNKDEAIEPEYEPSIVLLQDPDKYCSGPLFVRGGIPIYSSKGFMYEIRNRVTLCRCGKSENMPFCDAKHVSTMFNDKLNKWIRHIGM